MSKEFTPYADTPSAKDAILAEGQHINRCVILTDQINAVLEAALNADGVAMTSDLVSVAKRALDEVNDLLNNMDMENCKLADRA